MVYMRKTGMRRFIAIALLLGFACLALFSGNNQETLIDNHSLAFHDASHSTVITRVQADHGSEDQGLLKNLFPIIEDASEEELKQKSERDSDNIWPNGSFASSTQNCHLIQSAQQKLHTCISEVRYKNWNTSVRLSVLASQASLFISFYHKLILHN